MNKKLIAWALMAALAFTGLASAYNYIPSNYPRYDARYRGGIFGPPVYSYARSGYLTPNFAFQTPTTIGRDYYRTTNSLTADYYRTQYGRYSQYYGHNYHYNCLPNYYYGDHGRIVRSQYNRCFQI